MRIKLRKWIERKSVREKDKRNKPRFRCSWGRRSICLRLKIHKQTSKSNTGKETIYICNYDWERELTATALVIKCWAPRLRGEEPAMASHQIWPQTSFLSSLIHKTHNHNLNKKSIKKKSKMLCLVPGNKLSHRKFYEKNQWIEVNEREPETNLRDCEWNFSAEGRAAAAPIPWKIAAIASSGKERKWCEFIYVMRGDNQWERQCLLCFRRFNWDPSFNSSPA